MRFIDVITACSLAAWENGLSILREPSALSTRERTRWCECGFNLDFDNQRDALSSIDNAMSRWSISSLKSPANSSKSRLWCLMKTGYRPIRLGTKSAETRLRQSLHSRTAVPMNLSKWQAVPWGNYQRAQGALWRGTSTWRTYRGRCDEKWRDIWIVCAALEQASWDEICWLKFWTVRDINLATTFALALRPRWWTAADEEKLR